MKKKREPRIIEPPAVRRAEYLKQTGRSEPAAEPEQERRIEILNDGKCWCGRRKYAGHPLCSHCYTRTDEAQRADLRDRRGFAANYDLVVSDLKRHVRPRHAVPPRPMRAVAARR